MDYITIEARVPCGAFCTNIFSNTPEDNIFVCMFFDVDNERCLNSELKDRPDYQNESDDPDEFGMILKCRECLEQYGM
jgi:hypothetical protein